MIGSEAATDGRRTAFMVREGAGGLAPPEPITLDRGGFDRWVAAARLHPLDYVIVELEPERITLSGGRWGAAPVFVAGDATGVRVSWRFTEVAQGMRAVDLHAVVAVRHLASSHLYTPRTLFRPVWRLTERATLIADLDGLSYVAPEPAAHSSPRPLRDGADPVAAFAQILAASVRRYQSAGSPVVEVSGGLDSAIVALTLATQVDGPIGSYGILIGGPAGGQQVLRRQALLRLGGIADVTVPALAWLPFSGTSRAGPYDPYVEPYAETLTAALDWADASSRTVMTGIGGDELMALLPGEPGAPRAWELPPSPEWLTPHARRLLAAECDEEEHPAPVLHETALLAAACRAPVFLVAGAWPVNPLCTPELVRFCEWLPPKWRRGRLLQRELLHRPGLDHNWLYPLRRENFAHVMRLALARHGLPLLDKLMPNLLLADLGLVEPHVVEEAVARDGPDTDRLYELVNLELALRHLVG